MSQLNKMNLRLRRKLTSKFRRSLKKHNKNKPRPKSQIAKLSSKFLV